MMSAHDQLERQLRASVARGAGRRLPIRLRLRSWSRGLSGLLVTASSLAALAVAVFALVAVQHRGARSSQPTLPTTTDNRSRFGPPPKDPGPIPRNVDDAAVANAWNTAWAKDPACRAGSGPARGSGVSYGTPSAAMLSTIATLRRAATPADRLPADLAPNGRLRPTLVEGDAYVRYIRRVRVADGRTFYLVPAANLGRPPLSQQAANHCYRLAVAALQAEVPTIPPAKRAATLRYGRAEFAVGRYNLETSSVHEGVFLFTQSANGRGIAGGQSPATIQQRGMLGGGGGGIPPSPIVMDGIVPSGVATVTLQFPTSRHRGQRLPPLSVTGNVVNNVFVIPIPTLFQRGGWPPTAVWRAASGSVIKTIDERSFHP